MSLYLCNYEWNGPTTLLLYPNTYSSVVSRPSTTVRPQSSQFPNNYIICTRRGDVERSGGRPVESRLSVCADVEGRGSSTQRDGLPKETDVLARVGSVPSGFMVPQLRDPTLVGSWLSPFNHLVIGVREREVTLLDPSQDVRESPGVVRLGTDR